MANKTFKNPATGDTLEIIQSADAQNGEVLVVEVRYTPSHNKPPAHYHPQQQERFEVLAGSITVQIDGEQREYQAGESFVVPSRTVHAMWNTGETTTHLRWQISPALRTQQFFEAIWGMAQAGQFGKRGSPNLLQGAVLMATYSDEFRLASPAWPLQRVMFGILAPLGRALGYEAHYNAGHGAD